MVPVRINVVIVRLLASSQACMRRLLQHTCVFVVLDLLGSGRLPRPVCVRDLQVTVIYPLISLRLSVCIFDICDESVLNNQTITNLNVWNVLKKTLPPFQGCTGWVLINLAMDSRNTLALPSVYDLVSLTLDDWEVLSRIEFRLASYCCSCSVGSPITLY